MTPRKLKANLQTAGLALLAASTLYIASEPATATYWTLQAEAWPAVPGQITASGVAWGCGRGGGHFPAVRYRYLVGATWHDGDRLAFGGPLCGSESSARAIANEYPLNRTVRVRVNPAKAHDAVVSTAVRKDTLLGLALTSGLFLLFSVGAAYSFLHARSIR